MNVTNIGSRLMSNDTKRQIEGRKKEKGRGNDNLYFLADRWGRHEKWSGISSEKESLF
jgi:hypothetical protein